MSALDLLDDLGFEACAVVLGPEGIRARRGDTEQVRLWRSVTKTITAAACVIAVQEGHVSLDDPAGPPDSTLRHLLSHCSGLWYESNRTLHPPGTRRAYSNYAIDEAGRHVARATGMDFGDWVQQRVLDPLGMTTVEWDGSPSVGAAGSMDDLALFAAEMLRPTLLEEQWHRAATTPQFPDLPGVMPGFGHQRPYPFGLGFEIRGHKSPHWTGSRNAPATYGHFGMRGSLFWVDPVADMALVVGTAHDICDAHRRVLPELSDAVLEEFARP